MLRPPDTSAPPRPSRAWPFLRGRRVLARVAFYSAVFLLAIPAMFCHVMTSVPRQPVGPPATGYDAVTIDSEGLRLRGWLARGHGPRPAVLIVHGFGDDLESYEEIGDAFRRRGHSVLLVDLRGHGGSEGRVTTLGDHEREDVRHAMAQLRREGLARSGIVLVGYSLGAVASLLGAVGEPDVRAIVVEAPFDTLRETLAHHGTLLYGLPRWLPIGRLATAYAEIYAGFDADRVDAVEAARHLRAPLLAIAGGADPRMPEAVVRRIYDAHPGPKRLWVVPGATHVSARLHPAYGPTIVAFLEANGL